MFEAASESFVKAIGSETLLPISSIDTADNCLPLHVVVKKKPYWVWQTPKYQPTSFSLQEILAEPEKDLGVKTSSHELLAYSRSSKFSASGRLGVKIAKELVDVEVSGNDLVEVEADLGKVDKVESEEDDISDALQARHINLSHDLVEETRRDCRKCLCVVLASAVVTKDAVLSSHKEAGGNAAVDVPPVVHPEGNIDDASTNKITLPKGTAIAYSVRELLVYPDGGVKLVLLDGEEGRFVSLEDSKEESKASMSLDTPPAELFSPLIALEGSEKKDFHHAVLQISSHPACIPKLLSTMRHAHYALQRGANDETVDLKDLEDHLQLSPDDNGWRILLRLAEFRFDESLVRFPVAKSPSFGAVWSLFQAMDEMADEQLLALEGVTSEFAAPLVFVIQTALKNQPVDTKEKNVKALFARENFSVKFLVTFGFNGEKGEGSSGDTAEAADAFSDLSGVKRLLPPKNWKLKLELEAAFRVLFALYGGDADVKELVVRDNDCFSGKCLIL